MFHILWGVGGGMIMTEIIVETPLLDVTPPSYYHAATPRKGIEKLYSVFCRGGK